MKYKVGSIVTYRDFLGSSRTVRVEEKYADIKNGRPGFAGPMIDENGNALGDVWGYDSQIVRVDRYEA